MPNFNAPIPRAKQPTYHEGSALRSVRDSDANAKQWQKNKQVVKSLNGAIQAIEQTQKQVNALKRRIIGSANTADIEGHLRGEWYEGANEDTSTDDIWVVTGGASAGAYGALIDSPTVEPWIGGGEWIKLGGNTLGQWM